MRPVDSHDRKDALCALVRVGVIQSGKHAGCRTTRERFERGAFLVLDGCMRK